MSEFDERLTWHPGDIVVYRHGVIVKGDVAGHEFHGNQWTGGGGRNEVADGYMKSAIKNNFKAVIEARYGILKFDDPKLYNQVKAAGRFTASHGEFSNLQDKPAGVKQGDPRQCFDNAYKLALSDSKYTYNEGFATSSEKDGYQTVWHAWVTDSSGGVIDNTFTSPGTSYFGTKFPTDFVTAVRAETGSNAVINPASKTFVSTYGKP